ncbi:hypothetical protein EV363DRAFT_1324646 [Boletus edulis]|nr:hypothetical protein EV363DRAFT_1324646 [Boletus edulis]
MRLFLHAHPPHPLVPMTGRRARGWSTSCSSTTSQSSIASIYPRINQCSPLAEPTAGHTNVYGSFTTTVPAALWLRTHLCLDIPVLGICRGKQRDIDSDNDSPPDSPSFILSFRFGRTLMTDFGWGGVSTSPPSLSLSNDDNPCQTSPRSKLSCRTICFTCRKAGTNFPRCPRCDETWCSRACRLQGGKKHNCAIRKI